MPVILRTSRAHLDLIEIALHIAQENPSAAGRWLDKIGGACAMLASMPKLGRKRPDIASQLRSFPLGNYVIFYPPVPEGIQVLRVLHGARDTRALFD